MKKINVFAIITAFITLSLNFASYAQLNCDKLEFAQNDIEVAHIANIICQVIDDSYPELKNNKIKITAIEDNKMLANFSKGRLSFISFFTLRHLLPFSKGGYLIGYSRKKIFESSNPPSDIAIESVLAHELAHTLKWKRLGGLGSVGFGAYTTLGKEKIRAKYERSIDIEAIYRSVIYDKNYAQGLAQYRQWNLEQTEEEKRDYLKKTYYFEEQILKIEEIFQTMSPKKLRRKFYKKLKRKAPQSTKAIIELALETKRAFEHKSPSKEQIVRYMFNKR